MIERLLLFFCTTRHKIVCELALPNNSSWTPSMQIVQGYFHFVSNILMNQEFNSIHIYRGWSISKRSAEKSHQQTMFSRLESKDTKERGERAERQTKALVSKTFRSKTGTTAKRDFQPLRWADRESITGTPCPSKRHKPKHLESVEP